MTAKLIKGTDIREEILEEMRQIERRYRHHDNHFLFEERATLLQLVLLNQGNEELRDASLTLVMPNHNEFHVGTELPRIPRDEKFIERTPSEQAGYPSVSLHDNSVQVSVKLGDIEPGEPTEVFDLPLRICVGNELEGRRIGYSVGGFEDALLSAMLAKHGLANGVSIELAVGLGARRPHRRALARVEGAELDPGAVDGGRHGAAQRVDLPRQVALADAADRGIAAHLAQARTAVRNE